MGANQVSRESALEQWEIFRREYNLADSESELPAPIAAARKQLLRDIEAGHAEIADDTTDGVVVRQLLRRPPYPEMGTLTYVAPTAEHIARAGIGKEDLVNNIRYLRVACAVTKQTEDRMKRISGGDRSLMETIASLFLSA